MADDGDLKNLKKQLSHEESTIAMLGTNLYFEIPISIFRSTRKLVHQRGSRLLYFSGEAYRSNISYIKQSNILYDLITPRIADGLIIVTNLLDTLDYTEEFQKRCLEYLPQLPTVCVGTAIPGIPSVVLDNHAGMFEAVRHLIEEHGLKKIAFLKGMPRHPDGIERFEVYKKALADHSIPFDESLVFQGDFQRASGQEAVCEMLDKRKKIPGKDVEALICSNDYMASGALLELQKRGVAVPEDLALIGFDNVQFSECLVPSLSTIEYPFEDVVSQALDVLQWMRKGEIVAEKFLLKTSFIARSSCGCKEEPVLDHISSGFDYDAGLQNKESNLLKEHINRQILDSVRPTLTLWKKALISIRQEDKWGLLSRVESRAGMDGPGTDPWKLLTDLAQNSFSSSNYQNIIYNMGSAITSTLELPELIEILTKQLPQADIHRFCVCLYEDPVDSPKRIPETSRLYLAYHHGKSMELPEEGIEFPTFQLLPRNIAFKLGWKSWVVLSLYFKEDQLGFMLLDSESPHENLHWNLRNQVSSAFKGVKLLKETRESNRLLEEANRQKTQFFINVAHETKTPLTLIRNYLSLYMKNHPADNNLSIIEQNIELLLANMLNFLDVEKLQKGMVVYEHDKLVDLGESAQRKCHLFQVLAEKKKINMEVSVENSILIRIDPWALDRIFNNLLDNAVKYIHEGGRVNVNVFLENGKAVLRISDNGPGLPADTFDHIFEPYYLLSNKKTSKQGVGVGLSIVKKILDGLGSEIEVEKCRGGGVSFTIYFACEPLGHGEESLGQLPNHLPQGPVTEELREKKMIKDRPNVLIVDDNLQLLRFMQASLDQSYNILLAKSVSEAMFKLKTDSRPDLIIADIMMDGPDGFSFLKELSRLKEFSNIPFIFLSAMNDEQAKKKGLGLGAVDYIEKPFSIEEIHQKINSHFKLRKRQEAQDLRMIKNKIENLFYKLSDVPGESSSSTFDTICREFSVIGREKEILRFLLTGLLHKQIAAQLNISLRTVEYNIAKIYKKCNVSNKYELFTLFQQ
ncbi:MAG: substrate-binding domain-containing protein [Spirochaetales bacterium]|nr:substrate-binding domain-containing protein [Spirochaetales bacterium]